MNLWVWADGFATWHCEVQVTTHGLPDELMAEFAAVAIKHEIKARSEWDEFFGVELEHKSSNSGVHTWRFKEKERPA
jgi:hypothetical protein